MPRGWLVEWLAGWSARDRFEKVEQELLIVLKAHGAGQQRYLAFNRTSGLAHEAFINLIYFSCTGDPLRVFLMKNLAIGWPRGSKSIN